MCDGRRHVELKTWPEPFAALWDGRKTFEVRRDDRGYGVGDCLHLREWAPPLRGYEGRPVDLGYTGREIAAVVTYKVPGGAWGLPADLCVLAVKEVDRIPRAARPSPRGEGGRDGA